MTGRTAKGELSRQRLIEAAIDGMRSSGLTGAGINEIARAGGAPKGSIYHLFPGGKTQIACEALRSYCGTVVDFIDAAIPPRRGPRGQVEALFEAFARRLEASGCSRSCAVGAVSTDLVEEGEPVRGEAQAAFERWIDHLAGRFDFIADRARARSFAGLVLSCIEGAYLRGRAEGSGAAFREAGRWLGELAAQAAAPASARKR
jgi:TetR/AcrR family transcriptional repressor of lmrAB and yxaGH operons